MEPWNDETIKILNNVRINSLNLSEYHRRNYPCWFIFSWFNTSPRTNNNKRCNLFCFNVNNYLKFS